MDFKLIFREILENKTNSNNVWNLSNEKDEIIETGEILFANLKLSGQNNSLYYFDKEEVKGIMIKMEKVLKKQ